MWTDEDRYSEGFDRGSSEILKKKLKSFGGLKKMPTFAIP
jgi:hypothetical protein